MIAELDRENTKWQAMPAQRRNNYIRTCRMRLGWLT